MKLICQFSRLGVALAICSGLSFAGTITTITLGDFTSATVLDFNAVTLGNISNTDATFTSIGIASVVGTTGASDSDTYQVRSNSSRALWMKTGGQLVVVDPGTSGLNNATTYRVNLAAAHQDFGFGVHDQDGDYSVTFFSGVSSVGSTTFNSSSQADLTQVYFNNTDAFDAVEITRIIPAGFALDNITLESRAPSEVPEPSTLLLLTTGLIAGFRYRRRG